MRRDQHTTRRAVKLLASRTKVDSSTVFVSVFVLAVCLFIQNRLSDGEETGYGIGAVKERMGAREPAMRMTSGARAWCPR